VVLVNTLAIETATPACAVGLATTSGMSMGWVVDEDRRHTESLTPAISRALAAANLTPRELDRIVVDRGPGLFTGLRVGLATAQALADALGCLLVGLTSLEILAQGALDDGVRGELVAVVDGRRGEVFTQHFVLDEVAQPLDEPSLARPEELAATLGAGVVGVGDGVARYLEIFEAAGVVHGGLVVPPVTAALTHAAGAPSALHVEPLYLREADAVANFATRERS
jgi:tRNA threonylcarbamoyl adenosine modification protein YeaZ